MDDLQKMLEEASSSSQETSDDGWIEEDPLADYNKRKEEKEPDTDSYYVLDKRNSESSGDVTDSGITETDDLSDLSEKELIEKMRLQSDKYQAELDKLKQSRENFESATKEAQKSSKDRRGFFELNLGKSNLEGNTVLERLGYDKDAKNKPYEERHPVETFLDRKVTNPKVRFVLYLGFIILGVLFLILHHLVF